ncbi:glycosyltransferase family 2 protein [Falsiroseomonas oryzae]|uniref:glycosyltransferase family 2 protein n=1 Tax=Falsiroseomonas oryzae TaxID=2766473 RepID=UPI0022EA99B1|nr:glycosyltransferase family 2 protein [Roseomonas sp. MO-31]
MSEHATAAPAVSIGLPVYNGERYLDATIRSILGQSFADLELIVSDNASTDATAEICLAHAARDPRVSYRRQPRNLGAGPNYDACFHRARGRYFKWAAHDDLLAPDYLARAVAALDAAPDAVLCTTGITEIGPEGQELRRYANHFPGIDAARPARRLGAVIHTRHQCEDFFGLFRRAALVGSGLHGTYSGSDRVLLAEMALRGPWVSVPAPVFLHREHPQRYTRALLLKDRREAALWQDSTARRASAHFHLTVWRHYWRAVTRSVPDPAARAACRAELLRWWLTDGHAADVLRDAARAASPRLFAALRAAKRAVLGDSGPARPGALPPAE